MWIALSILALGLLIVFFTKGPNAVWGGGTLGLLAGIVIAIIGTGFNWQTIYKSIVIGIVIGGAAQLLALMAEKFRKKSRLFINNKSKDNIEGKYFAKYKDIINQQNISQLLEYYERGPTIFEPIRKTLTEQDQDDLYAKIDSSSLLTHQEKFETIIGLMMVFDGLFPNDTIVSRFGKIFGKEFMDTIIQKRNEFKYEITEKKDIK